MTYGFRTEKEPTWHCGHCGEDIVLIRVGTDAERLERSATLVRLHRDYCGASLIEGVEDYLRREAT